MAGGRLQGTHGCVPAKGKPGRHLLPTPVLPDLLLAVGGRQGEWVHPLKSVPLGELSHTRAEGIQKSQGKTKSYTFAMNSWGFFEGG